MLRVLGSGSNVLGLAVPSPAMCRQALGAHLPELRAWKLILGHTEREPQEAPSAPQNLPLRSCSGSGGTGAVLSPCQVQGGTGRRGWEWSRALLRGTAPAKT